jgi:ribosome-binding protein aMBF1 (putative translation factor)
MSRTDELIKKKRNSSKAFDCAYREEDAKLKAAIALMELREDMGWSQRELAERSGKPQSTIARIENGNMNATVKLLAEIGDAVGCRLTISYR